MSIKISLTNSKLGGVIPSINLPTTVCRADAPCKKGCYAKKGTWLYENVIKSLQNNLKEYNENPKNFFQQVIDFCNNGDVIYKFFRWFSSGDIVDARFFEGMVKVAKKCKDTKFLCFTKKFDIVNNYLTSGKKLPKNLKIIFSGWDKNFEVINPYNFPVAYVYFKDTSLNANISEFAIPCTGSCKTCKSCWSLEKGQQVCFNKH